MPYDLTFRAKQRLPLQADAADIEAFLLSKDPRASGAYNEMGRAEHARAFTAAQTAGTDIVDDLYFALVDTIANGGGPESFAELVTPTLEKKGWLGGDGRKVGNRLALIYDTNLRIARAAGRWTRYQASKAGLPYVRGVTAEDDRVRHPPKSKHSDHRAFEGIILPLDHPFVAEYWTPFGFRCRCQWLQMTRSQLARYKGGITSEAELDAIRLRLGPPMFQIVAPIGQQLADMVEPTNNPPPRKSTGWTVGGLEGLSPEQANQAIDARQLLAQGGRMGGLPPVDPATTEALGDALWQAILSRRSFELLDQALAKLFGLAA